MPCSHKTIGREDGANTVPNSLIPNSLIQDFEAQSVQRALFPTRAGLDHGFERIRRYTYIRKHLFGIWRRTVSTSGGLTYLIKSNSVQAEQGPSTERE